MMAEVLRSSQIVIDAKLDQWQSVLFQQAESRDQNEQVHAHVGTELRQSYDDLRRQLQVTSTSVLSKPCPRKKWEHQYSVHNFFKSEKIS